MSQENWQARLTRIVAAQVRRYRQERQMSAQRLADRCGELGFAIPRPVLSNLENGRRESVTLAELLVLAEALEVPPVLLAVPLGRQERVEFLPGMDVPAWEAALWWRGEGSYLADDGEGPVVFTDATRPETPVDLIFEHQDLVARWVAMTSQVHEIAGSAAKPRARKSLVMGAEALQTALALYEKELARQRAVMRARGLIPPPLPAELAGLDEQEPPGEDD